MIYTERLNEIARRREGLIATSARERAALAAEFDDWQKPIDAIDHGVAAVRFLKAHPILVTGAIVIVAALGRRHLVRWAGRGLIVWRTWRALQQLMPALNAAPRQRHAGRMSSHRSSA